jgi:DNA-binding transcriptional MocR family regulator
VLVTAGAQEAIELVSRVLVDPGDVVAIEQPGYFGSAMALQAAGARLLGIEVDGEGLRTDAVARAARSHRLKLVYTTPAAQMPTGAVLSESRRSALLEIADATQTPILEDDYDCEFRRDGAALPALKTRDRAGQVIYVGTFSKSLFPALRLGYVVAAPALLGRLAMTRFAGHLGLDLLGQAALAELLESGSFERHVRRLRRRYAQRREALQSALEESMPAGTRWSRSQGGLLTWVQLPAEVDGRSLRERASERGIVYHPGETFRIERGGAQEFALSFASQPPERIVEGIHELGRIARSLARRRHG